MKRTSSPLLPREIHLAAGGAAAGGSRRARSSERCRCTRDSLPGPSEVCTARSASIPPAAIRLGTGRNVREPPTWPGLPQKIKPAPRIGHRLAPHHALSPRSPEAFLPQGGNPDLPIVFHDRLTRSRQARRQLGAARRQRHRFHVPKQPEPAKKRWSTAQVIPPSP